MSYQALYRKFRPANFDDVKGQDAIVRTLKNQIMQDRIGHAYLFCGTRGTGKTTIAKLFAKTVNCEHPNDGSPCGECDTCRNIAAGVSMNVIEIDAASNNGVDNIREIVDEVSYSPTEGRYKVYIIDEVHMLSIGAFNALLKTLEEPPSYVIFILATTEVHKIPITILSRCQRYDFKRITIDTIADRMRELTEIEGVKVEEKALRFIAKCADGSMRDALSLLDQCIAFYLGQELTYDHALEVLGAVDTEVYSHMLRKIIAQDIIGAIHMLEELVMKGRELSQFVSDFTWYMRNLLLVKSSRNADDIVDVSTENLLRMKEEAKMVETDTLMRYIRIFSELSGQIRFSTQKRVLIEMAVIKLCRPAMESGLDALLDRVRVLEETLANGNIAVISDEKAPAAEQIPVERKEKAPLPAAIPQDVENAVRNWKRIVGSVEDGLLKSMLKGARPTLNADHLLLVFTDTLAKTKISAPESLNILKKAIGDVTGKEIEVEVRMLEDGKVFHETYPDLSQLINMEIEIEES